MRLDFLFQRNTARQAIMIALAIQIGTSIFPTKIIALGDFKHSCPFNHKHHLIRRKNPISNQFIEFRLRLQRHAMRLYDLPKRLIGQGFKPIFNIIQAVKCLHFMSVPKAQFRMQIFSRNKYLMSKPRKIIKE